MKNVSTRTSIWLVNALLNYEKLSLEELRQLWDESEEFAENGAFHRIKLQRIIAAAQDILGVVIECDRRDGYRYYISANKSVKAAEWLISSHAINSMLFEDESVRDRILLEEIPSGQRHLNTIILAISHSKAIEVVYRKFADSEPETCFIEPYCVKISHLRWYLLGCKDHRPYLQVFALDRIQRMRILQDVDFEMPSSFSPQDFFRDFFGVYTGNGLVPQKVRIRVDAFWRNYLRTLPIHASQREVETSASGCVFEYLLAITPDFVNHLLTYGASIEVLAPESLREHLCETARKMVAQYAKT